MVKEQGSTFHFQQATWRNIAGSRQDNTWSLPCAYSAMMTCSLFRFISRQLRETVDWLTSESMILFYIHYFQDSMWPNGELAQAQTPPSPEEVKATQKQAREKFLQNVPGMKMMMMMMMMLLVMLMMMMMVVVMTVMMVMIVLGMLMMMMMMMMTMRMMMTMMMMMVLVVLMVK